MPPPAAALRLWPSSQQVFLPTQFAAPLATDPKLSITKDDSPSMCSSSTVAVVGSKQGADLRDGEHITVYPEVRLASTPRGGPPGSPPCRTTADSKSRDGERGGTKRTSVSGADGLCLTAIQQPMDNSHRLQDWPMTRAEAETIMEQYLVNLYRQDGDRGDSSKPSAGAVGTSSPRRHRAGEDVATTVPSDDHLVGTVPHDVLALRCSLLAAYAHLGHMHAVHGAILSGEARSPAASVLPYPYAALETHLARAVRAAQKQLRAHRLPHMYPTQPHRDSSLLGLSEMVHDHPPKILHGVSSDSTGHGLPNMPFPRYPVRAPQRPWYEGVLSAWLPTYDGNRMKPRPLEGKDRNLGSSGGAFFSVHVQLGSEGLVVSDAQESSANANVTRSVYLYIPFGSVAFFLPDLVACAPPPVEPPTHARAHSKSSRRLSQRLSSHRGTTRATAPPAEHQTPSSYCDVLVQRMLHRCVAGDSSAITAGSGTPRYFCLIPHPPPRARDDKQKQCEQDPPLWVFRAASAAIHAEWVHAIAQTCSPELYQRIFPRAEQAFHRALARGLVSTATQTTSLGRRQPPQEKEEGPCKVYPRWVSDNSNCLIPAPHLHEPVRSIAHTASPPSAQRRTREGATQTAGEAPFTSKSAEAAGRFYLGTCVEGAGTRETITREEADDSRVVALEALVTHRRVACQTEEAALTMPNAELRTTAAQQAASVERLQEQLASAEGTVIRLTRRLNERMRSVHASSPSHGVEAGKRAKWAAAAWRREKVNLMDTIRRQREEIERLRDVNDALKRIAAGAHPLRDAPSAGRSRHPMSMSPRRRHHQHREVETTDSIRALAHKAVRDLDTLHHGVLQGVAEYLNELDSDSSLAGSPGAGGPPSWGGDPSNQDSRSETKDTAVLRLTRPTRWHREGDPRPLPLDGCLTVNERYGELLYSGPTPCRRGRQWDLLDLQTGAQLRLQLTLDAVLRGGNDSSCRRLQAERESLVTGACWK